MFNFLSNQFNSIFSLFKSGSIINEKSLEQSLMKIKETLLEADVPLEVVQEFCEQVKKSCIGKKLTASLNPSEQFMSIVHQELTKFLGNQVAFHSFQIPSVILLIGLQGAGKTTTIGKLAKFIKNQAEERGKKRKILCASVDFYRPAAREQLSIVAQKAGIEYFEASATTAVQAAQEIYHYFKEQRFEYLLLDTAGRMHVDAPLIEELKQIIKICNPQYKLLVIDSMIGQESLSVAKGFDQAVDFSGAILTKMDSGTRGGVAFAFRYALKKSIFFTCMGEHLEDIELFHPNRIAGRIIGTGDIQTLIEKAQQKIKAEDQQKAYQAISGGKMTLEDFANQIDMVNSLGSLTGLMKYMPQLGSKAISPEMMERGQVEIKRFRAIISSMTRKERLTPDLLDGSRKQRIARGSGVQLSEINNLLQRFKEAQQYAKLFKKMGSFTNLFR